MPGHGRYVFLNAPCPRRNRPMSQSTLCGAFRCLDIPMERMTLHGFRTIARTIRDEALGFRPNFVEHQLAHSVRDPNGRAYNRTACLPEHCRMMREWTDYHDRLRAGARGSLPRKAFGDSGVSGSRRSTPVDDGSFLYKLGPPRGHEVA